MDTCKDKVDSYLDHQRFVILVGDDVLTIDNSSS
jgi:hypothetical protein